MSTGLLDIGDPISYVLEHLSAQDVAHIKKRICDESKSDKTNEYIISRLSAYSLLCKRLEEHTTETNRELNTHSVNKSTPPAHGLFEEHRKARNPNPHRIAPICVARQ